MPLLYEDERLDKINESLSLIQLKSGLTFGTDAYLLSAMVRANGGVGADLGSGTGVASLLCLSKSKLSYSYAIEIQSRYGSLISRNAELNGLSSKLKSVCSDIRNITIADTNGELDTVISNPPYLKSNEGFATKSPEMNAARREMNGTIDDFAAAASRLLRHGGIFYTVYRPDRLADLIYALKQNRLEPKKLITVYPDKGSKPCLILVESKKGAASSVKIAPPLFIYKDNSREYTDTMALIYNECSLEFLFKI